MMTRSTATVAVITEPGRIEYREVPLPTIGSQDALVEVEANGVCGSDHEMYKGEATGFPLPIAPGHEPLGRIVEIGSAARHRLGVNVGDRVVVNSALPPDGTRYRSYGSMHPDTPPGLWSGFATHLFLSSESTVVPMSSEIDLAKAAFHNPLANGFEWTVQAGGVREGDIVAVLGAGPRALACALAALHVGAAHVTMVGLAPDAQRLDLALKMGVHHTLTVTGDDPRAVLDRLVGGRPRVVVDTTPRSVSAVHQAIEAVADRGTVVLAGIKGPNARLDIPVDTIVMRRLTLHGPVSKTLDTLRQAVAAIESGEIPLLHLTTVAYPLSRLAETIESLASTDPARPIHARIEPGL